MMRSVIDSNKQDVENCRNCYERLPDLRSIAFQLKIHVLLLLKKNIETVENLV